VNELRTPRLIGTPAGPGDFADVRRLHSDPRVMATLSADGKPFSEDQTRSFCNELPIIGTRTASASGSSTHSPIATSSATAESNTPPSKAATKSN